MIIRKPYAFLIQNFKKIHLILLFICCYLYYKNMQLYSFIREFMDLGTYDSYNQPVTKYATSFAMFCMIIVILGTLAVVILLKHKNKPWKLYLIPLIEYSAMLITFIWARNYFYGYNGAFDATAIRALRDVILLTSVVEFPVIAIYLIRIFGIDLQKFNFKMDEEYLELNSEDREELEINIDIDKETFKRGARRLLRNLTYVYQEHKFVCNVIATILLIILLKNTYTYIFITNKSYKQGQDLNANGYTIKINNSYYTDKDASGKEISKGNNFIVLDITVKNNEARRQMDTSKFHIMNGIENYIATQKLYETEFQDYGTVYQVKQLEHDESTNFILIFKVSKKLKENRFVLYYQELDKADPHLRKIKLKLTDVSEIKKNKELSIGDELTFNIKNTEQTVTIEDYFIDDSVEYIYRACSTAQCDDNKAVQTVDQASKILSIVFSSNNYEGKDMIDFSTKYGKIKYIDSKNKTRMIAIKNAVYRAYYGKNMYIKIPSEVANSKKIELIYTIRNNQYIYKLK